MTTVAATRECMAADSFVSDGNRTVKLLKAPNLIVGYAGSVFYATMLAKWVLEGQKGTPPRPSGDEKLEDIELLILRRSGLSLMDGRATEMALDGPYASIGSGSDVALGSLWRDVAEGRSPDPAAAIEAAAAHDGLTKLPVHVVYLKHTKKP